MIMIKQNKRFPIYSLATKMFNYKVPQNTERNVNNTAHDVISDVIKPNDTRKITCPPNVVQHIFIDSLSIST